MISLDLELGWGNLERLDQDDGYREAARRAREVVPALLSMFEEFDVAATWAVVGMLFGDDRGEWQASRSRAGVHTSVRLPTGLARDESWSETTDPLRYGPSLVRQILRPGVHEVATHTFSHFLGLDRGTTPERLQEELVAARTVAEWWGFPLSSIVFPRNQYAPRFDAVLAEEGITAYRGNPRSWMWRFRDAESGANPVRRLARLADAYLPVLPSRNVAWDEVVQPGGLADVRASFFLRPYSRPLGVLEPLRMARLARALRRAARRGEIFHLWWHPHNFSADLERNLSFLRRLLDEFRASRKRWGMESLTMAQVSERARLRPSGQSVPR